MPTASFRLASRAGPGPSHPSAAPHDAEPRVLVVHADEDHRHRLVELAGAEGWECMGVGDADEVLRLAAEYEPDLILMDANLPEVSGFEVCGELRASDLGRHTPVMLLSDFPADEDTVARGLLAGADDFVSDLTRIIELRARMRVQLRNKRYRDALVRVRSERDHLRRDASIDPLTGVLNRRTLERVIREAFEGAERFALLFIDVDHFKSINDSFGHDVGDRVLRVIADWLRAGSRPGDHCGRYGGEEFVLVVAGAGPESARLVAERHRKAIEALTAMATGGPESVSISVGVSVRDPKRDDQTVEALLRDADAALYDAKHLGRNRVAMAGGPGSLGHCHRAAPEARSMEVQSTRRLRASPDEAYDAPGAELHVSVAPTLRDGMVSR